jgi:hypothetical protein
MSGNIFQNSANALNTSGQTLGNIANPNSFMQSMNSFANPYQSQVINDAVSRISDNREMEANNLRGQATMAGAYGGSRHGVLEAEGRDRFNRNIAETAGGLARQGFMDAGQLAGQQQYLQTNAASGLMNLGGMMDTIGSNAMDSQASAGAQQQQLLQAILSGAAGQYEGFANSPNNMLEIIMASLNNPLQGNTTTTQRSNPGLMGMLSLGAGLGGAWLGSPFATKSAAGK